jgi:hypothetical protein
VTRRRQIGELVAGGAIGAIVGAAWATNGLAGEVWAALGFAGVWLAVTLVQKLLALPAR